MKFDSKEFRLLDLNSSGFVPKSISDLLAEVSMIPDIPLKLSKLNDYVCVLEQEMKKIDGFRRELPLCMLLLNDAIWKLKEEVVKLKKREVETVVMEEFMPLKGNSDREDERPKRKSADWTDKKTWMSSAQLWTTPIQYENGFDTVKIQDAFFLHQARHQERSDGAARWSLSDQARSFNKKLGGAFLPFKKPGGAVVTKTEVEEEDYPLNGLSLSMPALAEVGSDDLTNSKGKHVGVASDDGTVVLSEGGSSSQTTQGKKQRRCWSHDLHQNFVKALFELGGAQAATPKHIREIMQVDGLTNDEVKSHLQKYRLHIRKLMPSSSTSASPNYEWLRRGERSYLRKPSAKQSASPEGPLHLAGGGSAKGASVTGGESMEEEEDRRSESCSWKDRHQKPTD
ncbi:transcription factor HHO5 [Coffea arabica]|uniref:Transcription factor HHO5 n=1 Tax=Coffea arabica TaxID=13443 RepID=A0A6P6TJJ7_COFAR|nr:transcription factor HHO5-like [Coffea arabica]